MKQNVRSPLIVLILLFVVALNACRHQIKMQTPVPTETNKLLYLFNGPLAFVWADSDPSRIIVILPRDPHGYHKLYFPDLKTVQNGEPKSFKMMPDGLQVSTGLSGTDLLKESFAKTDLWKRRNYILTVTLPVPARIMPVGQLERVDFEDPKTHKQTSGFMASSILLEYLVTDPGKITVTSSGLANVHPLTIADLESQYNKLCKTLQWNTRFTQSCSAIEELLAKKEWSNASVFLFGAGLDLDSSVDYAEHARSFFNDVLLKSFPHLTQRRLAMKPQAPSQAGARVRLVSAVFERSWMPPRLLPVSALIDCKAVALVVNVTGPTQ